MQVAAPVACHVCSNNTLKVHCRLGQSVEQWVKVVEYSSTIAKVCTAKVATAAEDFSYLTQILSFCTYGPVLASIFLYLDANGCPECLSHCDSSFEIGRLIKTEFVALGP